jgi:hypothetical protein
MEPNTQTLRILMKKERTAKPFPLDGIKSLIVKIYFIVILMMVVPLGKVRLE